MSDSRAPGPPAPQHPTFPLSLLWLLAALTLGWGINWPVLKVVLTEMGPMHFRTLCLLFGALGLFGLAGWSGLSLAVPRGQWARLAAIGVVNMAGWNICAVYGVRLMASGRAAILAYTMPAWAVLLSAWLIGEPLTRRRAAGVALAMGGVVLLLGNDLQAVGRSPLGALLMLGAATTWALGTVMMKRWPVDLAPSAFTAWQMLFGAVPIVAIALAVEPGDFNPFALSLWPMLGVLYNIFVCFIFCYWAWTKIALVAPVGVSGLAVMLVPAIGVWSGMLLLGERPGWADGVALLLVVGSLSTVMIPPRAKRGAAA
ncbi:MAG: DMT family transporter [Candidatus Methylomirabilales bacterium]